MVYTSRTITQPSLNQKQKTAAALLCLTGRASDYARVQLAHYNELEGNQNIGDDPDLVWPTWAVVKRDLENHFHIDVLKEEAYRKLANFQQGYLLIEIFTQQFDIFHLDAGVDNSYALHIYKENMDYNIYFQLSMQDPAITETLMEWKKHMIIVGKMFNWMRIERSKQSVPQGVRADKPIFTMVGTQPNMGVLMDTHAVQPNPLHVNTRDCYNCGKQGHISWNCKKLRKPRACSVFDPITSRTSYPQTCQNHVVPLAPTMSIATVMDVSSSSTMTSPPVWQTDEAQAYYFDLFMTQAWQQAAEGLKGKGKAE